MSLCKIVKMRCHTVLDVKIHHAVTLQIKVRDNKVSLEAKKVSEEIGTTEDCHTQRTNVSEV